MSTILISLAVILPALAGAFGLWSLGRAPIRDRADRGRAMRGSATMAIAVGVGSGLLAFLLDRAFTSTPMDLVAVALPAAGIGALFGLAAIGGYALMARRGVETAVAGVVLGPAFLVLLPVFLASAANRG